MAGFTVTKRLKGWDEGPDRPSPNGGDGTERACYGGRGSDRPSPNGRDGTRSVPATPVGFTVTKLL